MSCSFLIDGTPIANIQAPPTVSPLFDHAEILVNDTSLMGLTDAEFTIRLNPGSLANILIANVISPLFTSASSNQPLVAATFGATDCGSTNSFPLLDSEVTYSLGEFLDIESQLPSGTETAEAAAQAINSPFGGLVFRTRALAGAFANTSCAGARAAGRSSFRVLGGGGSPIDTRAGVDVVLKYTGVVDFTGDFSAPYGATKALVWLAVDASTRRARSEGRKGLLIEMTPDQLVVNGGSESADAIDPSSPPGSGITIEETHIGTELVRPRLLDRDRSSSER